MRRGLIVAGLVVAVAAGGFGIAWYAGKSQIEAELARTVAEADAAGWSVTYELAGIEGFPMGYAVTLEDVAMVRRDGGSLIRLPSVGITWEGADAERAVVTLPPEFQIDLPMNETARSRDPQLPPVVRLKGRSDQARAVLQLSEGGLAGMELEAASLGLGLKQPDYVNTLDLEISGFGADMTNPAEPVVNVLAETVVLTSTSETPEAARTQSRVSANGIAVKTEMDAAARAGMAEVLYGGAEGRARVTYAFEGAEGQIEVLEDPQGNDGTLSFGSATGQGALSIAPGLLDLESESTGTVWSLTREGAPDGGAEAARVQMSYTIPTAPTEDLVAGRFTLALEDVAGTDALWQSVDPGGALNRTPGNLEADIGLTLRLMNRMDRLAPGTSPAYEISNVIVNRMFVQALDAEMEATGDVEILQPGFIPEGSLTIEAAGLTALIESLSKAGLLDPDMRTTAEAILQVYARPADGPDRWESELRIGLEGLTLNGVPVQ